MTDRHELNWRTSSWSSGGSCVEVALDGDRVLMRDSKDRSGPVLSFSRAAFQGFLDFVVEAGATEG
jgi:hypothetical protein